jgi:hypothetical protein
MANEFKHKTVGTQMTQSEYEAVGGHVLDSQAAGDLVYASSTTQLSRLGIGSAGQVLQVNSGASAPEYTNTIYNSGLILGYGASDATINFATDNNIIFKIDNTGQIKLTDGALLPVTDDDVDLGSSSLQFKDGFFDGTLEADAITVGGTAVLTGGAVTSITAITNNSLVVGRDADNDIDFSTNDEIKFRAGAADQIKLVDGALAPVTDNDVDLGTSSLEFKDAYFDGTVTTDALAMATNTSGNLLIGNGSSFASTAITDLSAISSIGDTDTFLAIDADDGALKKVARSVVVSGLATSSAISNVADDSDPHLGGNLDVGTNSIITDTSNRNIKLKVHGTGKVEIQGNTDSSGTNPGTIILNCEQNSHGQTIKAQAHSAGVTNTLTLPAGSDGELVSTVSTQTLTNKRLTTPKLNEDVTLTATATELNLLDGVSGLVQADFTKLAAIDATDTEINTVADGNTSVGTTAVADGDGIVTNDGGTMRQTTVQTFATYFGSEITNMSNLVETGALNAGSITSGFGNIDIGSSTFDTTGAVSTGDISLPKQKIIKIGGSTEAHDFGDEHSGHGITITMEAGAGLTEGKAVYVDSNGKAQHPDVDASSVTGKPAIGIAMSSVSSGATVQILTLGIYHDDTYGFSAGSPIIITGSSGALTTTASDTAADGDIVQRMGVAITADTAFIMPSIDEIEHAG